MNNSVYMMSIVRVISFFVIFFIFCTLWTSWGQSDWASPFSETLPELLAGNCSDDCMENSKLVDHIRSVIVPPSGHLPVMSNPKNMMGKGQEGQVNTILKHFNEKKGGFFIEAGAFDGQYISNTLYLETQLGWTGLLVEPNRGMFKKLTEMQRNAFGINSCLSTERHPMQVKFSSARGTLGKIEHQNTDKKKGDTQCFPLFSILLALGQKRIDFFSLDIEGSEIGVLKTIPFDKLDIEVILVETNKINITVLRNLMSSAGYDMHRVGTLDHIFYKRY